MDEVQIIAKEYFRLWCDSGLGELKPEPLSRRFALVRNTQVPAVVEPIPAVRTVEDVRVWLGECTRCGLCKSRSQIVFGSGDSNAKLMFVGEAPGHEEENLGTPFSGKVGELLTKIIEAMGYTREQVYITNTVKCRPPEDRIPSPEEIQICSPFLTAQIETVKPHIVVALGLSAAAQLLGSDSSMSNLRGRFHVLPGPAGTLVMPTYHPAYLLRNPNAKRLVWDDMKFVKSKLESFK